MHIKKLSILWAIRIFFTRFHAHFMFRLWSFKIDFFPQDWFFSLVHNNTSDTGLLFPLFFIFIASQSIYTNHKILNYACFSSVWSILIGILVYNLVS